MSAPPDYHNDLSEPEGAMLRWPDHHADDNADAGLSNIFAEHSLVVSNSFATGSSRIVDLDLNG
jgi:hypothetical protein